MAKTFIIKLTIVVDRPIYEPHLPAHRVYIKQLEEQGQLLLSGPFADRTGGMVMIRADSWEEAEAIARNDPLVQSGVDSYELREWLIWDGYPEHIEVQRPQR